MALLASDLVPLLPLLRRLVPEVGVSGQSKGSSGRVGVVGGCREYTGAPFFAARSALMVGTDLAHVFCARGAGAVIKGYSPELIVHPVLREGSELPELLEAAPVQNRPTGLLQLLSNLFQPSRASDDLATSWTANASEASLNEMNKWLLRMDCLVVGPGLGRDPLLLDSVSGIMSKARELQVPMIVDADGLYLVNQKPELVQGYTKAILTPNRAEFTRLLRTTDLPASDISSIDASSLQDVQDTVKEVSKRLGGVTVLRKGDIDVISNGTDVTYCGLPGSGRRCGGQGDVLAGSLAAFACWAFDKDELKEQTGTSSEAVKILGSNAMQACFAACLVTRRAAWKAYERKRRAMTASDVLYALGDSMEMHFPSPAPLAQKYELGGIQ